MGVTNAVMLVLLLLLAAVGIGAGLPEGDKAVLVGGHQGRSLRAPACRLHYLSAAVLP